jgi:hypothetical protein
MGGPPTGDLTTQLRYWIVRADIPSAVGSGIGSDGPLDVACEAESLSGSLWALNDFLEDKGLVEAVTRCDACPTNITICTRMFLIHCTCELTWTCLAVLRISQSFWGSFCRPTGPCSALFLCRFYAAARTSCPPSPANLCQKAMPSAPRDPRMLPPPAPGAPRLAKRGHLTRSAPQTRAPRRCTGAPTPGCASGCWPPCAHCTRRQTAPTLLRSRRSTRGASRAPKSRSAPAPAPRAAPCAVDPSRSRRELGACACACGPFVPADAPLIRRGRGAGGGGGGGGGGADRGAAARGSSAARAGRERRRARSGHDGAALPRAPRRGRGGGGGRHGRRGARARRRPWGGTEPAAGGRRGAAARVARRVRQAARGATRTRRDPRGAARRAAPAGARDRAPRARPDLARARSAAGAPASHAPAPRDHVTRQARLSTIPRALQSRLLHNCCLSAGNGPRGRAARRRRSAQRSRGRSSRLARAPPRSRRSYAPQPPRRGCAARPSTLRAARPAGTARFVRGVVRGFVRSVHAPRA